MIFSDTAALAVLVLISSSLLLLLTQHWRWMLIGLAFQSAGVFWLAAGSWPVSLAAVKLVAGVMSGAVVAIAQSNLDKDIEPGLLLSQRLFRLAAAGLVLIAMFSIAPAFSEWLRIRAEISQAGLILVGMGFLQMGNNRLPSRIISGLLMFLGGFEVIYASLEISVLVAGLLAVTNLGLALAGTYLMSGEALGGGE